MPLLEDTVLEDRYRIDKLLAYGGMSAVYRAYDTNLQVEVAIKENYFRTPQAIEQFKREAQVLAKLRHPRLPRVLQHFTHEGQQYLVMEFIEGADLWEMIKQRGKPFTEPQSLDWIDKVCDAVAYLHSQSPPIIHRDVKPQNIKVMPDGQVVLIDFGIFKEGDTGARTATGARGVTPGFSPPEQYSGGGSSPASDVYALGATLYALLTAVKPPDSVSLAIGEAEYVRPDKLNPSINPAVAEAITWAMQPKPNARPQTVEDWQRKLRDISQAAPRARQPVAAPPPAPARPAAAPPAAPVPATASQTKWLACPACGSQNRADVRFCERCGQSLIATPTTPPAPAPAPAGLTCTACGARNRPGTRFCEECGAPLGTAPPPAVPGVSVCPACGRQNRAGIRFCEECGAPLGTTPPAAVPRPPVCPACGARNRTGVRFCEVCGASLA